MVPPCLDGRRSWFSWFMEVVLKSMLAQAEAERDQALVALKQALAERDKAILAAAAQQQGVVVEQDKA